MVVELRQSAGTRRTRTPVIDCDIHVAPKNDQTLSKYMSAQWREHHATYGGRGHFGAYYPRANMNAARTDSWPTVGGPPGSDLPFLQEQLINGWGMDFGIMTPLLGGGGQTNLDYGNALAHAINEWQLAEWTELDPRMKPTISVDYEDSDAAVAEIELYGNDKRFAEVLLVARTNEPLGRRKYWKMYEAACKHDLPIGIHFGGSGGAPNTGAGWPSFYYEDHCGMPTAFEAQVISMVFEGIFERFPTLRIVLIEGGFAWLPPLCWRMDNAYKKLKSEVPHLKKLPSEYVKDHIWLTTQPVEEPTNPAHFHDILRLIGPDKLMFATDYPHWDFDAPDAVFPTRVSEEIEVAIMAENARAFYKL